MCPGRPDWSAQAYAFSDVTNGKVSVLNSSTVALAANSNRKYALLVNDSDTDMYLALKDDAVVGEGIRLNKNGGWYEITATNLFTGAVNAICATTGKNLTTIEGY